MRRALALGLLLVASTAARAAECRLEGKPFIVGSQKGEVVHFVDARLGEIVTAWLVAPGRLDGKPVLFSQAPGGKYVAWGASGCPAVEIAWRRVEPRPVHTETTSPNKSTTVYSNAVVFGPRHGAWLGWDKLEYFETPLPGDDAWSRTVTAAHPSLAALDIHDGLGVMRLAATVVVAGKQRFSTADAADFDGPTISDRVFRYTFRRGDDFLGWLTSYFNVPYLFASAGHFARAQAEHYVGADCADLLVAAMRRAGRRDLDYTSVSGFLEIARKVGGPVLVDPTEGVAPPQKRLRFGEGPGEVRPGDLLIIDYVGWDGTPRLWDHVLAVVEDRAPGGGLPGDGYLGPEDLTADSGDAKALVFQPLALQGKINVLVVRIPLHPPT